MPFSQLTLTQVELRQGGNCARCGESLGDRGGFSHHLMPENFGGTGSGKNCVLLCERCHLWLRNERDRQGRTLAPLSYFPYARIA